MPDDALVAHALELLATNDYLTLSTVGDDGLPWASPVWGSSSGLTDFFWVSSLETQHSRNLASRPSLALVVFDSTVPAFHGRALYARATARALQEDELAEGLRAYPGPKAAGAFTAPDPAVLTGDSPWRLFRARAIEVSVLCPRPARTPCPRHGRDEDHRTTVWSA